MSNQFRDPTLPLHGEIYSRLGSGSITVDGTSVPVYDRVPEGSTPPYIVIGEDQIANRWSTKQWEGAEVLHRIHAWSTYPGAKQIKNIRNEVVKKITNSYLDLSGDNFKVVTQFVSDSPPLIREGLHRADATDELRHVIVNFRFRIEDIS